MSMKEKSRVTGREIWLVTCAGPSKKTEIVGILSARRSTAYVKDFVERQYADHFFSIDEKVALALGHWKNPYKVSYAVHNGAPHAEWMICGGNPYMEARLVKIKDVVDGELLWDEMPHSDTCACWSRRK